MAQSTSPRAAGRGEQAISFSRCDPHPSHRHAARISPLSAPIFARDCRRWSPASHDLRFEPRFTNGIKARKRNADRRVANDRSLRGAARAERRALASRRPTTALCHWDYSSHGSTWARLRDTRGQTRRVPRQPVWHFQRCTSRAGHSAGRLMPRPPGSDGDEPPPAGTVSRSAGQSH